MENEEPEVGHTLVFAPPLTISSTKCRLLSLLKTAPRTHPTPSPTLPFIWTRWSRGGAPARHDGAQGSSAARAIWPWVLCAVFQEKV